MKILYGAGNINGSNLRLSHFLRHTQHDVRCAAFFREHQYLETIHWTLDALTSAPNTSAKEIQELTGIPFRVHIDNFTKMLDDISDWNPDLIVTDYEFITAYISKVLDIPMISCSPLHLIDGVKWERGKKFLFSSVYEKLKLFSGAVERFIYSPFGYLNNAPELLEGFDWITPYEESSSLYKRDTEKISKLVSVNNCSFNTGNSQNLYHQLKKHKKICVSEDPSDLEARLNGIFVDTLGLGLSIGEAEKNHLYCMNQLDILFEKDFKYCINDNEEFLHERLDYDN